VAAKKQKMKLKDEKKARGREPEKAVKTDKKTDSREPRSIVDVIST
jgi:hypothetical protein